MKPTAASNTRENCLDRAIGHWESNNYRIFLDDITDYIIEICCPNCHKWTDEEVSAEALNSFELRCNHCDSIFSCQFKIVIDRLNS